MLALFAALAAFFALYGFIADPATVMDHLDALRGAAAKAGLDPIAAQSTGLAQDRPFTGR